MLKLCVYIPESHLEAVKQALFEAGAGRIGNYQECCWQILGTGQFRPNERANPYLGSAGQCESVAEYRVEMVCDSERAGQVLTALRKAHPYEEPAYDFTEVVSVLAD